MSDPFEAFKALFEHQPQDAMVPVHQVLRRIRTGTFDVANEGREIIADREGKPVSCASGCAYCCYQKITVDIAQGLAIYLYLHPTWTPELEQRLIEADREQTRHRHATWFQMRRPCVFLKEESFGRGTCTVYPVRPVGCAGTFSVGPPADCSTVDGQTQLGAVGPAAMALGKLHFEISMGQRDDYCRTLPGAVLAARATIEGLPAPPVHKVTIGVTPDLCDRFDEIAER